MPKLKESKNQKRINVFRSIAGRITGKGLSVPDERMATVIGKSKRTYQNRIKDCSDMPLHELWRIADRFELEDKEIIELIKGGIE